MHESYEEYITTKSFEIEIRYKPSWEADNSLSNIRFPFITPERSLQYLQETTLS